MPSDEFAEGDAEVEVVKLVHMLLMHLLAVPMAASLQLANNRFGGRQYWLAKLQRMESRSFGRWSYWRCMNGAGTLLAVPQSQNRIVQVRRTRRNSNGVGDQEELLEMWS